MIRSVYRVALIVSLLCLAAWPASADETVGLTFERLSALRSARNVSISPDGSQVAYTLSIPRTAGSDDDGPAWVELHVVATSGGEPRAYVHGEVSVSGVRFTPDGRFVTYLAKRAGDDKKSLWAIPLAGGESRRLIAHDEAISTYRVSPDGGWIAYVALEKEDPARKKAEDKGYKQEVFEENWRPRRAWVVPWPATQTASDPAVDDAEAHEPEPLPLDGSVFELEWMPDGTQLALTIAATPLIDDQYMARRVHIVRIDDGAILARVDNPGKLGMFLVSPDGKRIAMISAADPNDPKEGRLLIGSTGGGEPSDAMPEFEAHVSAIAWKDERSVIFVADVGVESTYGEVDVESGERKTHLSSDAAAGSPLMRELSLATDGQTAAFSAESPTHPREIYVAGPGETAPRRLTDSNPWLSGVELARQEVVRWKARDGVELDGMLIHPLGVEGPAPLLLMVHGGPEAHDRNGWVSYYSRPGQLAAAQGYAVLYPNYRGSTGRGVEFSKLGQGDAAGKEFDDLVDAVDHLVKTGVADRDRVGITGGSYGGYASGWCATALTEHFRAGVMFVGISNKISKGLTTEIPVEDEMVHTRYKPWTRWEFSLERSPIYHVEQSRTALLIAGGTDDSRVHPSQSLQLYRALKLIGKTPVRYVRYPGEGHGNRKAAARDDYMRRLMRWMDHFVKERNTELPPVDLELDLGDNGEADEEN